MYRVLVQYHLIGWVLVNTVELPSFLYVIHCYVVLAIIQCTPFFVGSKYWCLVVPRNQWCWKWSLLWLLECYWWFKKANSIFGLVSSGRDGGAILEYYTFTPGEIPEGTCNAIVCMYWYKVLFEDIPMIRPNDECEQECVKSFGNSLIVGWPEWPYCEWWYWQDILPCFSSLNGVFYFYFSTYKLNGLCICVNYVYSCIILYGTNLIDQWMITRPIPREVTNRPCLEKVYNSLTCTSYSKEGLKYFNRAANHSNKTVTEFVV